MKGQLSNSSLDLAIGLMVPVLVIGAIGLPIMSKMAQTVNATGTTIQVLNYVPFVLVLAMFVGAISLIRPTAPTRSSRSRESSESEKEEPSTASDESSEESKPGIEILGYRIAW